MIEPKTSDEKNWLLGQISLVYPLIPPDGNVWIGMSDEAKEGEFRWLSDDSLVTEDLWAVGQPDNRGIRQILTRDSVNFLHKQTLFGDHFQGKI